MENIKYINPIALSILLILFCLGFATTAMSQDKILDQKFSIELNDLKLEDALIKLQNKSQVNFSYDKNVLPERNINMSFENERLKNILKKILKGSKLNYRQIGDTVVINPDKSMGSIDRKQSETYTLSGHIRDQSNYETLIGATIYETSTNVGSVSNEYGFYSLSLPAGHHSILFSYIGFDDEVIEIYLNQDITQDIELSTMSTSISEVVISASSIKKEEHVSSTEVGAVDVDIETIKKMPALFGEIDVIKAIQLLPGITSIGEGGSGLYVRGGNTDQNLILLDEAPVYNATHLGGFFSTFNPDAIKDLKVFKAGFPANYGGRLSSVIDIRMKDGNRKNIATTGGIGTIMSRLAVEAPLGDKGSVILAGRRTYLDVFAKAVESLRNRNRNDNDFELFFYDLNAKLNYQITEKDRLFASGYFGRDVMAFDDETNDLRVDWGNTTTTLRWNRIYSPKLFSNLTYYYSNYDYFLKINLEPLNVEWRSKLKEHSGKLDFTYYPNPDHTVKFGAQLIQHRVEPGQVEISNDGELIDDYNIGNNQSLEPAVYAADEWNVTDKFKVDAGLRLSGLLNRGPADVVELDENFEPIKTTNVEKGTYNSYWNLEPRLKLRYMLNEKSSLKGSYTRTAQYIHLASNGNFSSPFDIWFTSSPQIKPQLADQLSLGYFTNLFNNNLELTGEVYYKDFKNAVDFKDRARLLFNQNLETEIRIGEGHSYGFELLLQKNTGKLTGWIGYTFSKARRKIQDVNDNQWYNAKYDKPHDLSIVAAYEISKRVTFGANFTYASGGAITLPVSGYDFYGSQVPIYSQRNDARLPNYHRLDCSLTLKGKKNANRRFQTEWVFSLFNAYNRKNAFVIAFGEDELNPNISVAKKRSIFSRVPAITFNFKY